MASISYTLRRRVFVTDTPAFSWRNNFAIDGARRNGTYFPPLIVRTGFRPKFHKHRNIAKETSFLRRILSFLSLSIAQLAIFSYFTARRTYRGYVISGGKSSMEEISNRDLNPLKAVRSSCRGNSRIRDLETRFDEVEILSHSLFLGYRFSAIFARI